MSVRHYVLLATDGFIRLPTTPELCPSPETLKSIYIFGFAGGLYKVDNETVNPELDWRDPDNWPYLQGMTSKASIPSPAVWAEVGDDLYITLINLGMPVSGIEDPHTVHMHGAHVATQLDGFPETSFGVPMWMDKNAKPPTATYYFHPESPGTMMYHCHQEASEHVQMGMYGALVIYPSYKSLEAAGIEKSKKGYWFYKGEYQPQIPPAATNRSFAYDNIKTYFDREYVMLLSDIDSVWHESVQTGTAFNAVNFKPDFWLVNGRAFPDTLYPHPQTLHAGNASEAPVNYESYVKVRSGEKFLLRMINMGYQVVPWHIHGWHFTVAGKDAHVSPFLQMAQKEGMADHEAVQMGFTLTFGSGETYDLLLTADDKRALYRNYIVNGQDGLPSLCRQIARLRAADPTVIADIPVKPVLCPKPKTVNYSGICREPAGDVDDNFFPQFYPMHNHDDYKVTNNGAYPGGQLAYIQTDAPLPKLNAEKTLPVEDRVDRRLKNIELRYREVERRDKRVYEKEEEIEKYAEMYKK